MTSIHQEVKKRESSVTCQFDLYKENKDRIKVLRLSNPFTVDEVFSPVRLISSLTRLEKLILDQIHSKYLHNLLKHLIRLLKITFINPFSY